MACSTVGRDAAASSYLLSEPETLQTHASAAVRHFRLSCSANDHAVVQIAAVIEALVDRYLRCFFNIFLFFYFGRGVEMGVGAVPVFAHVLLLPFILK